MRSFDPSQTPPAGLGRDTTDEGSALPSEGQLGNGRIENLPHALWPSNPNARILSHGYAHTCTQACCRDICCSIICRQEIFYVVE